MGGDGDEMRAEARAGSASVPDFVPCEKDIVGGTAEGRRLRTGGPARRRERRRGRQQWPEAMGRGPAKDARAVDGDDRTIKMAANAAAAGRRGGRRTGRSRREGVGGGDVLRN
mmetsp:Transcript_17715/g.35350  ORF Transcript_17715/g.35350 Transcript_17715/m.35350 type:complete len:113 (+) Transcript_17715:244-582(+)